MHARFVLALLLVAVSAGRVDSAPPERAGDAVWPEGFLESLENHADPAVVLSLLGRALDGTTTPAARLSGPAPRPGAGGDTRTFHRARRGYADVPMAADPGLTEYRPAVAASPRRQDAVVSAYVAAPFPDPRDAVPRPAEPRPGQHLVGAGVPAHADRHEPLRQPGCWPTRRTAARCSRSTATSRAAPPRSSRHPEGGRGHGSPRDRRPIEPVRGRWPDLVGAPSSPSRAMAGLS